MVFVDRWDCSFESKGLAASVVDAAVVVTVDHESYTYAMGTAGGISFLHELTIPVVSVGYTDSRQLVNGITLVATGG